MDPSRSRSSHNHMHALPSCTPPSRMRHLPSCHHVPCPARRLSCAASATSLPAALHSSSSLCLQQPPAAAGAGAAAGKAVPAKRAASMSMSLLSRASSVMSSFTLGEQQARRAAVYGRGRGCAPLLAGAATLPTRHCVHCSCWYSHCRFCPCLWPPHRLPMHACMQVSARPATPLC